MDMGAFEFAILKMKVDAVVVFEESGYVQDHQYITNPQCRSACQIIITMALAQCAIL